MKKEDLNTKAKNWNFNVNDVLKAEDLEFCLRKYHGNDWYDKMDDEDKYSQDAYGFIQINALLLNGLMKTDKTPLHKEDGSLIGNLWQVFYHKDLDFPEEYEDWMMEATNGESEVDFVEWNTNEEVQEVLAKYDFTK